MSMNQIKVELVDYWGKDKNAAHAAWASSTDLEKLESKSEEDIIRVVTGLVHSHHDTPKERLWMEFFLTMPIFCERQFDKYRMTVQYQGFELTYLEAPFGRDGITQNELSGRYRTIPDRPFTLPKDVEGILIKSSPTTLKDYSGDYDEILKHQHTWYQIELSRLKGAQKDGLINNSEYKRAREVLRGVLGTAFLTDMRIVMNMNAFEHIINQRLSPEAQTESRVVAYGMIKQLEAANICPHMLNSMIRVNGWDAWMKDVEDVLELEK